MTSGSRNEGGHRPTEVPPVHDHGSGGAARGSADSAPADVRFCARCGVAMTTREVAGAPRRCCPSCGFVHYADPKVGVGVLAVSAGRLLLVRRVMAPQAGRWGLPGGYLDAGEDPRAAAAREAREEAGVLVQVGELLDLVTHPPGAGADLFLVYAATILGGEPVPGDDADAVGLFTLDDLPPLAFTSRGALEAWLAAAR